MPGARFVAEQMAQKLAVVFATKLALDLARVRTRIRDRPRRKKSRMHDHVLAMLDHERSMAQPIDEFARVGLGEHLIDRVTFVRRRKTFERHHEKEIVVAEHAIGSILRAKRFHASQHIGRFRPTIHQIADEENAVFRGIEPNERKQFAQLIVAALNIADNVGAHELCAAFK